MKRKHYSVEQIVAALKQAELGMAVGDIVRQLGISEQTFYRWKKQYSSMQSEQVKELKQLQDENARLKELVAELSLDKAILQDVAAKSGAARAKARGGPLHHGPLRAGIGAGLQADTTGAQHPVSVEPEGSQTGVAPAPEGIGAGAHPLGLSTPAHSAQARRLAARRQPNLSLVLPGTATVASMAQQAAQDGRDTRAEAGGDSSQPCLVHGFRGGPIG